MVVVAVAMSAATGCSAGNNTAAPTAVTVSSGPATKQAAAAPTPAVVAVSPAGVTTKINVPARSTEEEYFLACHAATLWMQGRQGDRQALIEGYLAAVQAPGFSGAGTWNAPCTMCGLSRS